VRYAVRGTLGGDFSCAHGENDPVEGGYYKLIMSLATSRSAIQIVRINNRTGKATIVCAHRKLPCVH
jgi:hypothetical protein